MLAQYQLVVPDESALDVFLRHGRPRAVMHTGWPLFDSVRPPALPPLVRHANNNNQSVLFTRAFPYTGKFTSAHFLHNSPVKKNFFLRATT